MTADEIKDSLREAIEELNIAEHELNRPNDDIVAMSVCLSAKIAMNAMMRMYLLSNGSTHVQGKSLMDLQKKCAALDNDFASLDFSRVFCNSLEPHECDHKYCLDTRTVSGCLSVAGQLKTLVLKKLNLTEAALA